MAKDSDTTLLFHTGHIDEIRISKGSKYMATFGSSSGKFWGGDDFDAFDDVPESWKVSKDPFILKSCIREVLANHGILA